MVEKRFGIIKIVNVIFLISIVVLMLVPLNKNIINCLVDIYIDEIKTVVFCCTFTIIMVLLLRFGIKERSIENLVKHDLMDIIVLYCYFYVLLLGWAIESLRNYTWVAIGTMFANVLIYLFRPIIYVYLLEKKKNTRSMKVSMSKWIYIVPTAPTILIGLIPTGFLIYMTNASKIEDGWLYGYLWYIILTIVLHLSLVIHLLYVNSKKNRSKYGTEYKITDSLVKGVKIIFLELKKSLSSQHINNWKEVETYLLPINMDVQEKRAFIKSVFSVEYHCSFLGKCCIDKWKGIGAHTKKRMKGKLITRYNWMNLVIGILLFIVCCFTSNDIIKSIVVYRIVFRSIEIIFAFYTDVTSASKKRTNLGNEKRIELAVISYFEIITLYASLYHLSGVFHNDKSIFDHLVRSFGIMTFTDIDLTYYISLPSGNCSHPVYKPLGWIRYFMMLQIITSITLVVFSIARYLGEIKSKSYGE